jgi:type VI secretion system protein ImpH
MADDGRLATRPVTAAVAPDGPPRTSAAVPATTDRARLAAAVPATSDRARLAAAVPATSDRARLGAVPAGAGDLFQLLRRLEAASPSAPRIGRAERPGQETVRMGQEPSLAFPAGSLASVGADPVPGDERLQVLVNCFGMLGPNGALPLHMTEYVRQRQKHHGDSTLARFLDLFHHRMLSFFYRAWADAQPAVQRDRPETDRFVVYLGALLGIATPGLRDRDALPDAAKLFYAGRLAAQNRSAEGLRELLNDYFEMPAEIEEFVGEWAEIPAEYRWRLGDAGGGAMIGRLGENTHLGSHVWLSQSRFRIVLGPLRRGQFDRVSPGGSDLPALVALVRGYAGDELHWDLRLCLRPDAVPAFVLGGTILGQTSWLCGSAPAPSDDMVFDPQQLT